MRFGLVVNPVAGLGGAVGLKGTDGPDTVAEALRRGATPQAGPRARRAFAILARSRPGAEVTAAPGALGAAWLAGLGLDLRVLDLPPLSGTARDTRLAVAAMAPGTLAVFAGGDGTARDVAAALPAGGAMLGIPCGVKMHSGVFALSPEAAGHLLADLVSAPARVAWTDEAEVMDIDEAQLRAGRIAPRLFGLVRAPRGRGLVQAAKGMLRRDEGAALAAAAAEIAAAMAPGTLYVIGPGTSAGAVVRALGQQPTILGVDAVRDGRLVARDARAADLDRLAGDGPVRLVLGVTGQQGFLLGRGNQQIGPGLIARAGREGLVVLATEDKLRALAEPRLWVDTGDPALDARLGGYVRVHTGAGREMMMRIASGAEAAASRLTEAS
ncbi:MAG: NAD(+)/NADH kinase [Rhodobacteraceae bacterium]|nr:NAD(+)/NADH kinase [Paracoccaceae bacterium]